MRKLAMKKKQASTILRGLLVASLAIAPVGALTAYAQINGSISGRVVNERDEVVPGATVTVASAELAITRATTSDGEGYFTVPNLRVGVYVVTVKAAGFAEFKQE